jgi:hypothetical protein
MIQSEVKTVKPSIYGEPLPGYLAIESRDDKLLWDRCREEFAKRLSSTESGFYFCGKIGQNEKIVHFLKKTETILDLKEFSAFSKTTKPEIIWIYPSLFWMNCSLKRQLLTIFLRAGINYNIEVDNYEEALWSPDIMGKTYAAETKLAICRFLYGYTEYKGRIDGGWWGLFNSADIGFIKRVLVLPSDKMVESGIIGINQVWG